MSKVKIDRNEVKKATNGVNVSQALVGDRLKIYLALLGAILASAIVVYMAYGSDRLELVYLDREKIDAPVLLDKVRNSDELRTDRRLRGFVRRVVGFYFLSPDDTPEFARRAVSWLRAHSGKAGKERSESFYRDWNRFESARKNKYASFFPVNDHGAMKIRRSGSSSGAYVVEVPGTYVTKDEKGEHFFNATLKLAIEEASVSGIPTSLGSINMTGLSLKNGIIEYVEDITRPKDKTKITLFVETKGATNYD